MLPTTRRNPVFGTIFLVLFFEKDTNQGLFYSMGVRERFYSQGEQLDLKSRIGRNGEKHTKNRNIFAVLEKANHLGDIVMSEKGLE